MEREIEEQVNEAPVAVTEPDAETETTQTEPQIDEEGEAEEAATEAND